MRDMDYRNRPPVDAPREVDGGAIVLGMMIMAVVGAIGGAGAVLLAVAFGFIP